MKNKVKIFQMIIIVAMLLGACGTNNQKADEKMKPHIEAIMWKINMTAKWIKTKLHMNVQKSKVHTRHFRTLKILKWKVLF